MGRRHETAQDLARFIEQRIGNGLPIDKGTADRMESLDRELRVHWVENRRVWVCVLDGDGGRIGDVGHVYPDYDGPAVEVAS